MNKSGLIRSEFADFVDSEPVEARAHTDGIRMDVFFDGEETAREITLRPRHIESICAMREDWWEKHWAAQFEADA